MVGWRRRRRRGGGALTAGRGSDGGAGRAVRLARDDRLYYYVRLVHAAGLGQPPPADPGAATGADDFCAVSCGLLAAGRGGKGGGSGGGGWGAAAGLAGRVCPLPANCNRRA
jgi:hypothetical protein